MESLILLALNGGIKFTYGNTGKEVTNPLDLAYILKSLAELEIIVNLLKQHAQEKPKANNP